MNDRIQGVIYGAVCGDILGLKYEGLPPKNINKQHIGNKTFFNAYSDDTEHLIITAKSLLDTHDIKDFNNNLTKELQKWFLTLPYGIGQATFKSIFKSFLSKKSGVDSAGNGALMRSGIFGLVLNNKSTIDKYVEKSTIITHDNEEAILTSKIYANLINYLVNNEYNQDKVLELITYDNEYWISYQKDIIVGLQENKTLEEMSYLWCKSTLFSSC